ncbi:hypothetical protein SMACR_02873 [Sordaria macrospora]|uniref:Uncharacterized protein n=1 Tax=Sordaria macrospora TaxID=5147 RepID=A0A8S8ZQ25_SORMA|nr:hypothetical protein SMACR_02873 [Sordaria macrospora]WPJ58227.1 hypothetical protein SMAC4_02873 [Sordaria macrospora]
MDSCGHGNLPRTRHSLHHTAARHDGRLRSSYEGAQAAWHIRPYSQTDVDSLCRRQIGNVSDIEGSSHLAPSLGLSRKGDKRSGQNHADCRLHQRIRQLPGHVDRPHGRIGFSLCAHRVEEGPGRLHPRGRTQERNGIRHHHGHLEYQRLVAPGPGYLPQRQAGEMACLDPSPCAAKSHLPFSQNVMLRCENSVGSEKNWHAFKMAWRTERDLLAANLRT